MIRARPTSLVSLAAGLLAAGLLAPAPARADARDLLLRSLEPKNPVYQGEQVTEETGRSGIRRIQRQTVYRKDNILRIHFPNGNVLFDDGKKQSLYQPRPRIVEEGPSRLTREQIGRQRQVLLNRRSVVEQLADDVVAGRPAYVFTLSPRPGVDPVRKVWVDRETFVQLRQDLYGPGPRLVSTYFTSIDFGTPPSAEFLTFTPPPGATITERGFGRPLPLPMAMGMARQWGGLLRPAHIPPGYVFRGFYRHSYRRQPGLVAVYRGPQGLLTLFQGPQIEGMAPGADRRPKPLLRVLSTRKGTADVTLVAPLSEEEMQRVMDSIPD